VKPTRVQLRSNLAYDKLARYLDELKIKGMIVRDPLQITEKGRVFFTGLRQDCQFCHGDGNKVPGFIQCGKE
jgi:predicted transcriptional regulator